MWIESGMPFVASVLTGLKHRENVRLEAKAYPTASLL
jgi:hypothetical protein